MAIVTQFTITKGNPLDFYIVIKESGTTTPLELDPSDTFTYTLLNKSDDTIYAQDVTMSISDALNGEVKGTITTSVSDTLPIKKGSAEDGYIPRPNLRLVVNGSTVAQGPFVAAIEDVYVIVG